MESEHPYEFGKVGNRLVEIADKYTPLLYGYNSLVPDSPSCVPFDSIHDRSQGTSYSTPPTSYIPKWPSQLTSPSQSPPPAPMPVVRPIAPATSIAAVQAVKVPIVKSAPTSAPQPTQSSTRKTLTDNDRQRICEYHEENPMIKQTKIGGTSYAQ